MANAMTRPSPRPSGLGHARHSPPTPLRSDRTNTDRTHAAKHATRGTTPVPRLTPLGFDGTTPPPARPSPRPSRPGTREALTTDPVALGRNDHRPNPRRQTRHTWHHAGPTAHAVGLRRNDAATCPSKPKAVRPGTREALTTDPVALGRNDHRPNPRRQTRHTWHHAGPTAHAVGLRRNDDATCPSKPKAVRPGTREALTTAPPRDHRVTC